jgi:hypothetical protein
MKSRHHKHVPVFLRQWRSMVSEPAQPGANLAPDGSQFPARMTYRPTVPSTSSRIKSAWPLCRAYSSIMCR